MIPGTPGKVKAPEPFGPGAFFCIAWRDWPLLERGLDHLHGRLAVGGPDAFR
jgi:hypothetical protein